MAGRIAVVLAAGKGVRMKSELPKVLVTACGKPLIEYVLDALEAAGVRSDWTLANSATAPAGRISPEGKPPVEVKPTWSSRRNPDQRRMSAAVGGAVVLKLIVRISNRSVGNP